MSISACLIVKNEADNLDRCLKSLVGVVDQIIVVDTGSQDKTRIIAAAYTHQIYDFKWMDDFAAARNAAISHASCDWILSIDADEVLAPESRPVLQSLTQTQQRQVFQAKIITPGRPAYFKVALFPNQAEFRYKGRVHEWLSCSGGSLQQMEHPDLIFTHLLPSPAVQQSKQQYYLRLLQKTLSDSLSPLESAFVQQHLGDTYQALDQLPLACRAYQLSEQALLGGATAPMRLLKHIWAQQARLLSTVMSDYAEALRPAQNLVQKFPDFPDGWLFQAYAALYLGKHDLAEQSYQQCLKSLQPETPLPQRQRCQQLCTIGLGRLQALRGDFAAANQSMLSLSNTGPELKLHLAKNAALMNQTQSACDMLAIADPAVLNQTLLSAAVWTDAEKLQIKKGISEHAYAH